MLNRSADSRTDLASVAIVAVVARALSGVGGHLPARVRHRCVGARAAPVARGRRAHILVCSHSNQIGDVQHSFNFHACSAAKFVLNLLQEPRARDQMVLRH